MVCKLPLQWSQSSIWKIVKGDIPLLTTTYLNCDRYPWLRIRELFEQFAIWISTISKHIWHLEKNKKLDCIGIRGINSTGDTFLDGWPIGFKGGNIYKIKEDELNYQQKKHRFKIINNLLFLHQYLYSDLSVSSLDHNTTYWFIYSICLYTWPTISRRKH